MPGELIPIVMFLSIAAVAIFRPLTTRIGKVIEQSHAKKSVGQDPQIERITQLMERLVELENPEPTEHESDDAEQQEVQLFLAVDDQDLCRMGRQSHRRGRRGRQDLVYQLPFDRFVLEHADAAAPLQEIERAASH